MRPRAATCAVWLCLAAACAGDRADDASISSARVGVAAPVLSAAQNALAIGYHRNVLTRDGLLTMAGDGRAVGRILESWTASDDRLTWRFNVRPGILFHDGTPVTASLLAGHVAEELASSSLGDVQEVVAESDRVLRITLKEPYAFLLEDISVIAAVHTVGDTTYGTGPYKVVEESPDRLLLTAVSGYYKGDPEIDRVEVRLFPDQRNAWSALMRDEIDMLYEVSRDALQFVRSESSVTVASFPRAYVYLLGFNVQHPALRDVRVRQALDRAVNRDEFVRVAMAGEGEPARGHVWPRHWAYDADAGAIGYDPNGAATLLRQAGLDVQRSSGQMPARLRLHCLVYEPLKEMGLVLQRQLAAIDVDLELEIVPADDLLRRIASGRFESFIFEMTSLRGLKFPYQFWHSGTPFVKHGYHGADDVLDRIRHASNDGAFKAATADFQRRVHEDPPAIFLAWGRTSRAVSTRFTLPEGDEDIYHMLYRWKPAKASN
jgi:peptide/nickel transport system substrate-binding protein